MQQPPKRMNYAKAVITVIAADATRGGLDEANAIYRHGIAKVTIGWEWGWKRLIEWAIAAYGQAIGLQPKHADAYTERGLMKDRLDREEEALSDFDRVVRLRPEDPWAYVNRVLQRAFQARGKTP